VTHNVYGESWWEERVDAVTQAVEAVTNAAQNGEKEEKRISLNPPQQEARITSLPLRLICKILPMLPKAARSR